MSEYYEVRIKGRLDKSWSCWLMDLTITYHEGDEALLSGWLLDQAALHGLLERIRDLNLKLISVTSGQPDQKPSMES